MRIEGHQTVKSVLKELFPSILFKKKQVEIMLEAISILEKNPRPEEFLKLCQLSDKISSLNYATVRKKYNYEFVRQSFIKKGLIPL